MSEDLYPKVARNVVFPDHVEVTRIKLPNSRGVLLEISEDDFTGSVAVTPQTAIDIGRLLVKHGRIAQRKEQADRQ